MKPILFLLLALASANAQSLPWIDISGTWRVMEGDDPRYSASDFDDSAWQTRPLPGPNLRSLNSEAPDRYLWLRRTFELPAGLEATPLVLTLGKISENYQIFLNGQLIAQVGNFTYKSSQLARPRSFELPALSLGRTTIAVRVWVAEFPGGSTIWWRQPDPGPYLVTAKPNAPLAAGAAYVDGLRALRTSDVIAGVVLLSLALILFLMFLNQRSRPEILWLALYAGLIAYRRLNVVLAISLEGTPWNQNWLERLPFGVVTYMVLFEFTWAVFRTPRTNWMRVMAWSCALPSLLFYGFATFIFQHIGFALLLLWVTWQSGRQSIPAGFISIGVWAIYFTHFLTSNTRFLPASALGLNTVQLGPYSGPIHPFLTSCLILAFVIFLTHRSLSDGAEKQRMSSELEAARTIQNLLISNAARPESAYHAVEAAYLPAQEVGGDFYQVIPLEDGGLLIVTGDVSGKGLKAAMIVSMVVGALGTRQSDSPGQVLAQLNRVLCGRLDGGFVTCVCARFDGHGVVAVANAGHLPPFLNGTECDVDAGLPLGLVPDVVYGESTMELAGGSSITFLSDGVVEAENAQRELFGFERTRETSGKTAGEIAAAAKAWGQNDDITVVTVRRLLEGSGD